MISNSQQYSTILTGEAVVPDILDWRIFGEDCPLAHFAAASPFP
jgi:hypothetical protein